MPDRSTLRSEDRHPLATKVRLTWQDRGGASHFSYGRTINISVSGLSVLAEEEIPIRSRIGFEIPQLKLRGTGSVRWLRRKGLKHILGIEFIGSFRWSPESNPLPTG